MIAYIISSEIPGLLIVPVNAHARANRLFSVSADA
jgi:hypothetical protein